MTAAGSPAVDLRSEPHPGDVGAVRRLVVATGLFRPAEVEIAAELVEERLARGAEASGYHLLLAGGGEGEGTPLAAYACYGPIAGTVHGFDLYWIAVDPGRQGRGLGRRLLAAVEAAAAAAGGRWLYADTSASRPYAPTRAFYAACGFERVADLPEFYAPGDGKAVFRKALGRPARGGPDTFRGPVAVRLLPGKGRGVVTTRDVDAGEPLCVDPCVMLGADDCRTFERTSFHGHYFAHPETDGEGCVVLGPTSLVNHDGDAPNCRLEWEDTAAAGWVVRLRAGRPLAAGEELTIDYACPLWFEPAPPAW